MGGIQFQKKTGEVVTFLIMSEIRDCEIARLRDCLPSAASSQVLFCTACLTPASIDPSIEETDINLSFHKLSIDSLLASDTQNTGQISERRESRRTPFFLETPTTEPLTL